MSCAITIDRVPVAGNTRDWEVLTRYNIIKWQYSQVLVNAWHRCTDQLIIPLMVH